MDFDSRGYLKPYSIIESSVEEFGEIFSEGLENHQHRKRLFEGYQNYTSDLKAVIKAEFEQRVNGSYTTKKLFPGDIDVVNFIDFQMVEENASMLRSLSGKNALDLFGVDANFVKHYPPEHRLHGFTLSDRLYWQHQFGYTAKNRNGKRFLKGFLKLSII